jgi:hypothetical protein
MSCETVTDCLPKNLVSTRRAPLKKALVCYLALLLCPLFLMAQISNNTALVGTVLDSTGSAVGGAKVTAVEQATKVRYSATTNDEGYYGITFIKSGTYDITVELTGFKKVTTVGVPVSPLTSLYVPTSISMLDR